MLKNIEICLSIRLAKSHLGPEGHSVAAKGYPLQDQEIISSKCIHGLFQFCFVMLKHTTAVVYLKLRQCCTAVTSLSKALFNNSSCLNISYGHEKNDDKLFIGDLVSLNVKIVSTPIEEN